MSTIHGTGGGLGPATSKRQVYSPLEAYWIAFQEWRKRESQRTQLCRRTDSDLGQWYYARWDRLCRLRPNYRPNRFQFVSTR